MLYYKALRDIDIWRKGKLVKTIVENELITKSEARHLGIEFLVTTSPRFLPQYISRRDTYKTFGNRFQIHKESGV